MRLQDYSTLVFDIKKMDMRTGGMTDYGFAVQPLIHMLKNRQYLIGGRYQIPVYRGSLPQELLEARKMQNVGREHQPRYIVKKLVEKARI